MSIENLEVCQNEIKSKRIYQRIKLNEYDI